MTYRRFRTLPLGLAAIMLPSAGTPVIAKDKPASAPIALIQPGASQLTCDALLGQINALASMEATPKKKKKGFGLGSIAKVLMVANPVSALAAPLMMSGGGMGGMMLNQATTAAEDSVARAQSRSANEAAMAAATAGPSIEAQRKARLMTMFDAKKC